MAINGFEDQTHELSDYEKANVLPLFLKGISKKVGVDLAITNKEIVTALKLKGIKTTDSRIRKIVNYVRTEGLVPGLIATSKGYYISNDPVEIAKYVDSLNQRAKEILRVKESFRSHLCTLLKQAS